MSPVKSRCGGDLSGIDSPAEAADETPAETIEEQSAEETTKVSDEAPETDGTDHDERPAKRRHRIHFSRAIGFALLPVLAIVTAAVAGYLKWQDDSTRAAQVARAESVQAATEGTVALLSYRADTVQKDLEAARGRLTGTFLNAYTSLTHEVVIPGAKQKQISAVATVPAAASRSATASHAVVLLFVNQTVIVNQDAPTDTASSVRVTLDKVGGRWLISGFDPV
jgi:Mce-associated membrane protein